uniref:GAF domain-containing protein n=1 Tax=Magnetococcus massalia (strain MO-1) TaxID=451514 RepID=A0A1S7LNL3_MAGMO|nr:Protein of unknown function [Candidatus Magnetococcus massalia]
MLKPPASQSRRSGVSPKQAAKKIEARRAAARATKSEAEATQSRSTTVEKEVSHTAPAAPPQPVAKPQAAKPTEAKPKAPPARTAREGHKPPSSKRIEARRAAARENRATEPVAGSAPQPTVTKPLAAKPVAAVTTQRAGDDPALASRLLDLETENRHLTFSRNMTREFVQSTGSMKQVMEAIFNRVVELLEAEAGSMWVLDKRAEQNICHLAEGPAKKQILGLRLPQGQGIVGQVIANNREEVVLDCTTDERFASQIDAKSGFSTQSMICVPLSEKGEGFGAIQIINKRSGFQKKFTEEDLQTVLDLSLSASIAVRNARLLESESRVKEMNTLMEISREVSSTLDLDQVITLVVNMADELADVSNAAVALIDEHKNTLSLAVLSGGVKVDPDDLMQQKLTSLMDQVRKADRTSYIADVDSFKQKSSEGGNAWSAFLDENGSKAVWATPLKDDESTLGVLWLESDTPHFAAGNKSDMLVILANQATVALRNASLFQRIPFADMLGKVGDKSKHFTSGLAKWLIILSLLGGAGAGLHYHPFFRAVSGPCTVEARFGQGVYLRVAGRIDEVLVKEGEWIDKGTVLAKLDETPIRLKLIEAESALAVLERKIVEAKTSGDMASMSQSIAERVAARATYHQAKKEMERVEVRAPVAGMVLTAKPEELVGREFSLGDEVLRLADPKNFTVVAEVPEEDLLDLRAGQTVSGVLRSRPGKGFEGEVIHVGRAYAIPAQALEEGVADTSEPEGFVAEIKVKQSDVELRPGMTGQARISTPESSILIRWARRIQNQWYFWFGFL